MSDLQTYAEAVRIIKEAILRSQYRAASSANKEQLSLYYGIGCYVSKNSRENFWGKGAIDAISQQLQKIARTAWFLGCQHQIYASVL